MAGEFGPRLPGQRFVAQHQARNLKFLDHRTLRRPSLVVVARDPDPVGGAGQGIEHPRSVGFEPIRAGFIMEIVAEAQHPPRAG